MWKIVNEYKDGSRSSQINTITVETGQVISKTGDIVKAFNDFFFNFNYPKAALNIY